MIDLFFASNQGQNKLYLNHRETIQFKDVTTEAAYPKRWRLDNRVSVVDINNDGLLDIYVCRVGKYEILKSQNQLLICQGIDKNGFLFIKMRQTNMDLIFQALVPRLLFLIMIGMAIWICIY